MSRRQIDFSLENKREINFSEEDKSSDNLYYNQTQLIKSRPFSNNIKYNRKKNYINGIVSIISHL